MKKYLFLLVILLIAFPVLAADTQLSLVPSCATQTGGPTCTVCDVVSAAINVANILASGLSGITLLMFVIGGFCLIISRGNEELLTKGKKIITGAVVGIVIVVFAWVIVNTVLRVLVKGSITASGDVQILSGTWWSPSCTIQKVTNCKTKDSNGDYPSVGAACSACSSNGISGSENCYCHKESAADEAANSICDDNKCECISLCETWSRLYTSYAGYQCFAISGGEDSAAEKRPTCSEADICPRASDGEILGKCCK
jgi:hypothetical protein